MAEETQDAVAKRGVNVVAGIMVAAIVVVCAAFFILQGATGSGGASEAGEVTGALKAVVHDGDGGVLELSLSTNSETPVTTSQGMNTIVVKDGAVFVSEADCDNQDCVRQGKLTAPGKQIICLPHRLWVEVVAEGQAAGEMNVDAAAGDGEDYYDVVAR